MARQNMDTTPENWYDLDDETPLEKEIAAIKLEYAKSKLNQDLTLLMFASMIGNENAVSACIKNGETINEKNSNGLTALSHAVLGGHFKCVQILVANCAEVNFTDENGDTPVMLAAKHGSDNIVQCLLTAGARKCKKIHTTVSCAALSGNLKCLETLVKSGVNLNLPDSKGKTTLMKVAAAGLLDVVEWLINAKAKVDLQCKEGKTALSYAASNGYLQCVEVLHTANAGFNLTDSDGQTPLMKAVRNGHTAVVEYLVKYIEEDDLNIKCREGKTAFFYAAQDGNLECIKTFLNSSRSKVDMDQADNKDLTPLMIAIIGNHSETVEYLLKHGANCEPISKDGMNALHYAAAVGLDYFQNVLLHDKRKLKNTVNLKNVHGQTPLMIAAANRRETIVNFLLKQKLIVDVNAQCDKSWTAVHYAANNGKFNCIKNLIKVSKDVNVQTDDGRTCLMIVCEKGLHTVVSLLISLNADVNLQCSKGRTALHYAVIRGSTKCAEELLNAEARINHRDEKGESPLILAVKRGQNKMVHFLKEHGANVDIKDKEGKTAFYYAKPKEHWEFDDTITDANKDLNLNKKLPKIKKTNTKELKGDKQTKKLIDYTDFTVS